MIIRIIIIRTKNTGKETISKHSNNQSKISIILYGLKIFSLINTFNIFIYGKISNNRKMICFSVCHWSIANTKLKNSTITCLPCFVFFFTKKFSCFVLFSFVFAWCFRHIYASVFWVSISFLFIPFFSKVIFPLQ